MSEYSHSDGARRPLIYNAFAHVTPIVAETRFPPMIDQGCASGLAGTANSNTAEAPMGATSSGMSVRGPNSRYIEPPVNAMPSSAPRHERARSCNCTVTGAGIKLENQRRTRVRDKVREKLRKKGVSRLCWSATILGKPR